LSLRGKKSSKGTEKKHPAATRTVLVRPPGPIPAAYVESRRGNSMITRGSRGFSFREVEGSGIAMLNARRWGLPMDLRRRSSLESNVDALKKWYAKAKHVHQPTEGKRIEMELEKVGADVEKEIKKGATKAKKEAVKVAKEAKKVEKKVEEEVEEVSKPRRGKKPPKKKPEQKTSNSVSS